MTNIHNNTVLYVLSTPIGNLKDITLRAIEILKEAEVVFCEDTRKTAILLRHYDLGNKKLLVINKDSTNKDFAKAIKILEKQSAVIVSDSGTPNLSDPASPLIQLCYDNNIEVIPIPGASSVTAFIASFPFDGKFCFYGFVDKINSQIPEIINLGNFIKMPVIIFVSPSKTIKIFEYLNSLVPDCKIYLSKELTKLNEFKKIFKVSDWKDLLEIPGFLLDKGEYCLALEFPKIIYNEEEIIAFIKENDSFKTKDLAKLVSAKFDIESTTAYTMILEYKNGL
ncbi:MAG: hypothetical protein J0G32_06840 [Alphaproteobacteria bacterium]|nr:hypothetical protein [Alphaproteobacteria bacterium]OJV14188.1 MAG: hypothetical protein BGO27_01660 [Alphaproteobacteria bacterium 33-17]